MSKKDVNTESFLFQDFRRSGINDKVTQKYIDEGYLSEDENGWKLEFPALTANFKTAYYSIRLKSPKNGQGKYLMPKGIPTKIFRPLDLSLGIVSDKSEYIIFTEGAKKAIKAVQEGFNCISLSGVYCWKQKPDRENDDKDMSNKKIIDQDEETLYADIISDIKNFDMEGKSIYLCYDSDMWHNPKVKQALYQFAAFLISEKGAIVKIILLPEGNAKGLDDYLITYGADEFQELMDSVKPITLKDIQNELSDKKKLIEFPLDIFPEDISNLILNMQKSYDAPLEYIAVVFLAVVSIIICGHYCICVKSNNKYNKWFEDPILWIALIGNPSQKKSPCLKIGKDILDNFDRAFETIYENKIEEYNSKLTAYEAEIKEYKNKIKTGEFVGQKPQKPELPLKPRFTTQNATIESMAEIIMANKDYLMGLAIYLDELSFLLNGLNQYKNKDKGNDLQYYLTSWTLTRQHIKRKVAGIDCTLDIGHNIIGSIQPKVLYKTLFKNGIESYDGLVERWLYACSNYLEHGYDDILEPPVFLDFNEQNSFEKLCNDIHSYLIENIKQKQILYFDKLAQKTFITFYNSIIKSKKSPKANDLVASYLQKQISYVARFALILQCFYDYKTQEIGADIVHKAIKLSKYFISCFLTIINDKLEANPLEDSAISYIKTKNLKSISPTQLFKNNENRYKSTDKARRTLENLARKGYGRVIKANNGIKFVFYSD